MIEDNKAYNNKIVSEEDFLFSSNQNYLDYKINKENQFILFNPKFFTFFNEDFNSQNDGKEISSSETEVSIKDKDINKNNQILFPTKKKTFFDEKNFEQKNNIKIQSFLFNLRKK